MNKELKNTSWKPVILLLLAAIFGYFSIRAGKLTAITFYGSYATTKINLQWVFWLTVALSVGFLLPLVGLVFRELYERDMLPKLFKVLFQQESREKFSAVLARLRVRLDNHAGRIAVLGLAILIIIGIISKTPLLREREISNFLNEGASGLLGGARSSTTPVSVLQIPFFTEGQNGSQYLRNCLKIVRELKSLGAKAVLIDIRELDRRQPQAEFDLIKELDASGIVVLGASDFYAFPKIKFSRGVFTLSEDDIRMRLSLSKLAPEGGNRNPAGTSDVTIELLRKYRNYSSDLLPRREGSTLVFGDYRIPIANDGSMYSLDRWGEIAFWPRIYAFQGTDSDTLRYQIMRDGLTFKTNLQSLGSEFNNKIVLIGQSRRLELESYTYTKTYAAALENIIQNSVTRKVDMSPLWLTALCIVISVFIGLRFHPLVSVLLIFLFGVGLLVGNSLLYDKANLFVEIVYPMLSVLMTLIIFPASSFVHRLGNPQ